MTNSMNLFALHLRETVLMKLMKANSILQLLQIGENHAIDPNTLHHLAWATQDYIDDVIKLCENPRCLGNDESNSRHHR